MRTLFLRCEENQNNAAFNFKVKANTLMQEGDRLDCEYEIRWSLSGMIHVFYGENNDPVVDIHGENGGSCMLKITLIRITESQVRGQATATHQLSTGDFLPYLKLSDLNIDSSRNNSIIFQFENDAVIKTGRIILQNAH